MEKLWRYAPTKENLVEPYLSINQHQLTSVSINQYQSALKSISQHQSARGRKNLVGRLALPTVKFLRITIKSTL